MLYFSENRPKLTKFDALKQFRNGTNAMRVTWPETDVYSWIKMAKRRQELFRFGTQINYGKLLCRLQIKNWKCWLLKWC